MCIKHNDTYDFCSLSIGSGSIEFPEFLKLMTDKMASSDPDEDMREAFKVEYFRISCSY